RVTAHDRQQRAGREIEIVVLRLSGTNGRKQYVMLLLIHVVLLTLPLPLDLAVRRLDAWRAGAKHQGRFSAHHEIERSIETSGRLPVRKKYSIAIREEVVDLEVIVNISAIGRNRAAANPDDA